MPEESEKDLLKKIQQTLEEIKAILTLTNQDKLSEVKNSLLKEGSVKLQVYNLCDGSKTTQEIAQALQKSPEYVNSYLSILRREGLIRTVEKDSRLVHEQIF
ncbi:MAG: ArsR family transcriptional regulator [Candidatus Bathyarchaeia archaeon]